MDYTDLKLIKITDRIWSLPNWEDNDWCTLALVIGDRHVMMLDSGASKRHVEYFFSQLEINGLPKPDICSLSHWHWDHTYGLAWLEEMGIVSIANKDTNELLKAMQKWEWSDEAMKKRIKTGEDLAFSYPHINDEYPDKSLIKIASADIVYDDELNVDLGGVTVRLKKIENSHSYDCSVMYIPEEKAIFLGDIIYEDLLPEQPLYYAESHNKLITGLRKFDFKYAISGHQEVMDEGQLYSMLAEADVIE